MSTNNKLSHRVLASLFLALAFILPFFTGQIPEIGQMLCPLHIPVLLCGYICGWKWGLQVGLIAPLLRSFTLGMPPLFPSAIALSLELATYGLIAGYLYKIFPPSNLYIYLSLIISMIIGRIVWGVSMLLLLSVDGGVFTFSSFIAGSLVNAIPGIIIQIILVPLIIIIIRKNTKKTY